MSDASRPGSGPSTARRGLPGCAVPQRRQDRGAPRISRIRSRSGRPPRRRRGSARCRTGEGRRRRGRRETVVPPGRNLRMRRTSGIRRNRGRATGRRRPAKGLGMRLAGGPGAWRVRRSMTAEPPQEGQRRVAETAYSRFPWSMAYPFHVPQEGHRAVHLMVEDPQEEHRKGMRYLRL